MGNESMRVYPRGFIGHADVEIGKDQVRQSVFQKIGEPDKIQPKPYNAEITDIYDELFKVPYRISVFDVRERILKAGLDCFGFKNFYDWVLIQESSNSVNEYHSRFIEDTVKFIETGKRTLSLQTWARLVEPNANTGGFSYSEDFLKKIKKRITGTNQYQVNNFPIPNLLRQWCTQPNGIEDLYMSMYILFGRYSQI